MKLSIIILNYNTAKLIKYLLQNLESLALPFAYEVILVDNSPRRDLAQIEFLSELPYRLLFCSNHGYAHGNNFGIKAAQGEYVLILNPDIYLPVGELEKMLAFMAEHEEIGILGPKLLYPNGDYQYSCSRFPDWHLPFYRRSVLGKTRAGKNWLSHYLYFDYDHQRPRAVDWLFGACLLVRKKAIEAVGGLDEKFFMYFEDLDWCRRFHRAGWQVWYYPLSAVIHFHHRDSADKSGLRGLFTKLGRAHMVSWFKYMWKWR